MQLHVTLIHVLLYSEYDYVDQLLLENIITNFHQITAWNSRLRTGHKNSYGRDLLKTVEYFNHKVFIYLLHNIINDVYIQYIMQNCSKFEKELI